MSDGILKDVLQLEKKIETALDQERERAASWLAEACRTIDSDVNMKQLDHDLEIERQGTEALYTTRRTVAQKLRRERQWARSLAELSEERLVNLLKDRLKPVLTGSDDDCPDDQS
jgi:hypothetical protein